MESFKFSENRTFGIELEMTCTVSKVDLVNMLVSHNIMATVSGYMHNTDQHNVNTWYVKDDGSLSAESGREAMELVSPILKGTEGIALIRKVCAIIAGVATVNRTCGFHVHHDVRDYTERSFVNLAVNALETQEVVNKLVSPSRRDNYYSKPLPRNDIRTMKYRNSCDYQNSYSRIFNLDRYHVVNFKSYAIRGTVEFRQHQGTVDAQKIISWIVFTQAMVEISKVKMFIGAAENFYTVSVSRLKMNGEGLVGDARNFLRKRYTKFMENPVASDARESA